MVIDDDDDEDDDDDDDDDYDYLKRFKVTRPSYFVRVPS